MTVRGTGVKGFAKGRAFVVNDRGQRNPFEDIPAGSILVAKSVSLSDSALIDFRNVIQNFDVIVNPDLETVNGFEQMRSEASDQLTLDM